MRYEKDDNYNKDDLYNDNESEVEFWYNKYWELNIEIDELKKKYQQEKNDRLTIASELNDYKQFDKCY